MDICDVSIAKSSFYWSHYYKNIVILDSFLVKGNNWNMKRITLLNLYKTVLFCFYEHIEENSY